MRLVYNYGLENRTNTVWILISAIGEINHSTLYYHFTGGLSTGACVNESFMNLLQNFLFLNAYIFKPTNLASKL